MSIAERCPIMGDQNLLPLAGSLGVANEMLPKGCQKCLLRGRGQALTMNRVSTDIFRRGAADEPAHVWTTVVFLGEGERLGTDVVFTGEPAETTVMARSCFDFMCLNVEVG